jgi:hypothetical protein
LPHPRLWPHEFFEPGLSWLRFVPLPDTFLKGAIYTAHLGRHGQLAYLHGELSPKGWWSYFPVATVLKYPTPALLLAGAGLAATLRGSAAGWPRRLCWTLPPLTIFTGAISQNVDVGVRSILPLAPFLGLWTAAAVARFRAPLPRAGVFAALALSISSGALAWPDFLAWFNPLFGGTPAADRWLADSNLDWGQDMPELAAALRRRSIAQVRLAFFGSARPEHWGVRALDGRQRAAGWYAVSRSFFSGIWGEQWRWLRALEPVEYVGGSIALIKVKTTDLPDESIMAEGLRLRYEQGKPAEAAALFDQLLARSPNHYGARYQLAAALEAVGATKRALDAWRTFLPMAEAVRDTESAATARAHIAELADR